MPGPHLKVGWLAIMLTVTGCAGEPTPAQPAAAPAILVEAPTPTAAPPPALPWPAGPDCRATLAAVAALPPTARGRLEPTAAPLAVTVLDGGAVLPADAALAALQWDLPVATDGRDDAPCLVLVDRTATARAAARQLLAHDVVRSTYRRGSRSIANPEHAELRRSLRELDDEDGVEVLATGDPGLDLIGLLAGGVLDGIDRFQRGSAEKQTRAALAATPASLEQVVWEPYTYEVTTVEAARSGILRAALVDRRLGLAWPVERPMRETHRFGVAAGQNVKDRQLLERSGRRSRRRRGRDGVGTRRPAAVPDRAGRPAGGSARGWRGARCAGPRRRLGHDPAAPGRGALRDRRRRSGYVDGHARPRPDHALATHQLGRAAGHGGRGAPLPAGHPGGALRADQASAAQPRSRHKPPIGVTSANAAGAPNASA